MEPEGSWQLSQDSATCSCPEPDQSSLHLPNTTSWRSILILSSYLHLRLLSDPFPSGLPTNALYAPPLPPYEQHALPI